MFFCIIDFNSQSHYILNEEFYQYCPSLHTEVIFATFTLGTTALLHCKNIQLSKKCVCQCKLFTCLYTHLQFAHIMKVWHEFGAGKKQLIQFFPVLVRTRTKTSDTKCFYFWALQTLKPLKFTTYIFVRSALSSFSLQSENKLLAELSLINDSKDRLLQ